MKKLIISFYLISLLGLGIEIWLGHINPDRQGQYANLFDILIFPVPFLIASLLSIIKIFKVVRSKLK